MAQSHNREEQLEGFESYWSRRADTSYVKFATSYNTATVDIENKSLFLSVNGGDSFFEPDEPLLGKTLACSVGDGLAEFADAPFEQAVQAAWAEIAAASLSNGSEAYTKTVLRAVCSVAALSHYTRAFPPCFTEVCMQAAKDYFDYLLLLQEEYKKLIAACFAETPYDNEIKEFTAASRFYFYCMMENTGLFHSLTYHYTCRRVTKCIGEKSGAFTTDVTESLPAARYKRYLEILENMQNTGRTQPNNFEKAFDLPVTFTELNIALPALLDQEFELARLDEVLVLEFEQMLRLNLRMKRCKNCGHYFVLKGNYPTDYCDKIPQGENKPCQMIAATDKYSQKLNDCPPLAIYNREYKRLHGKMKAGRISHDQFNIWKELAKAMRDRCAQGKINLEEFQSWLNGYRF